jgi:D-alanyl-D-alanine carboxypeptidase
MVREGRDAGSRFAHVFDVKVFSRRPGQRLRGLRAALLWMPLMAVGGLMVGMPTARATVQASIVIDADSGKVLESYHADQPTYPASLTKLMTLFLVFGKVRSGELTLRSRLKVSPHAAAQAATSLGLRSGETISVKQAILALVTTSANDAAVVLAEAVGGTEAGFATMMNRAALRIGMTKTTFRNASGLPDPHQLTTARDMATLALALIHDFPDFYHFFSVRSFVFRGRTIRGHDHLLGRYAGADGMKTGFIQASGFNLVSSARRHGSRVIGVVLGGASIGSRDHEMMHLLDLAFATIPQQTPQVQVAQTSSGAEALVSAATKTTGVVKASISDGSENESRGVRWEIAVGSGFGRKSAARAASRRAARRARHELSGARAEVIRIRRSHHVRYSVRFVDLDKEAASRACKVLRRRKSVCTVLQTPPEKNLETASTS